MAASRVRNIIKALKRIHIENDLSSSQKAFGDHLRKVTDEVTLLDASQLNFKPCYMSSDAPVTYFPIHEEFEVIASIFALKDGMSLPLHDHPNMYGFLRCIYGCLEITSYTKSSSSGVVNTETMDSTGLEASPLIYVDFETTRVVDIATDTVSLTPSKDNIHSITAINGAAAFVDFLTPPYGTQERRCHYYTMFNNGFSDTGQKLALVEINCPSTFWCATAPNCQLLNTSE